MSEARRLIVVVTSQPFTLVIITSDVLWKILKDMVSIGRWLPSMSQIQSFLQACALILIPGKDRESGDRR